MGRQAYMNRLALGRSPYDPPEVSSEPHGGSVQGRASSTNADGYTQQYDERGHPVNPTSKSSGRELRRAKNDVLSTMGIVVSGEDGGGATGKERHKANLLTAENDYGLIMATFDQVMTFLTSWWTISLGCRIQTFRNYTYLPFTALLKLELQSLGVADFFFAGLPAWAGSFFLSISRAHFLEPLMTFFQSRLLRRSENPIYQRFVRGFVFILDTTLRTTFFAILGPTYMFSVLQALSLIPARASPSLQFFVPFSEASLIQLPPFPSDFSAIHLARFGLESLMSPISLVYLSSIYRPKIEARIYRILRRHLPKPDRPDDLSIRIAVENDLIEWTVPSLGRRSDEEKRRGHMSIIEEVKYEISMFKNWICSWFRRSTVLPSEYQQGDQSREERVETLRHRIEQIQNELGTSATRAQPQIQQRRSLSIRRQSGQIVDARGDDGAQTESNNRPWTPTPDLESLFNMDQVLSNEQLTHSPAEITPNLNDVPTPAGRLALDEVTRSLEDVNRANTTEGTLRRYDDSRRYRRASRSNTLFSQPSSPESSPPTSPRVRASLVHQNSEVITMQLELLSNRTTNTSRNQPNTGTESEASRRNERRFGFTSLNRRESEILDAILSQPNTDIEDVARSQAVIESIDAADVGIADLTPQVIYESIETPDTAAQGIMESTILPLTSENPIILPNSVEEPLLSPGNNEIDQETEVGHQDVETDSDESNSDTSQFNNGEESMSSRQAPHRRSPQRRSSVHHRRQRQSAVSPGVLATNDNNSNLIAPRPSSDLPPHRVTILSSHPVDSTATHLASFITSMLIIPLESYFLRSIAIAYVTSSSSMTSTSSTAVTRSNARALLANIRTPSFGGPGTGSDSRRDLVPYLGKLGLAVGLHAIMSTGILSLGTTSVIGLGRGMFGWGNL